MVRQFLDCGSPRLFQVLEVLGVMPPNFRDSDSHFVGCYGGERGGPCGF